MNTDETGRARVSVRWCQRHTWVVSEADGGRTDEREARLVRVCSGDAPTSQCRRDFMLEERDNGEDGVGEGGVEADERVG
jgi:hypothetical protein